MSRRGKRCFASCSRSLRFRFRSFGRCSIATVSFCTTALPVPAWSWSAPLHPPHHRHRRHEKGSARHHRGGERRPVLQQADVGEEVVQHVEEGAEHDAEEHLYPCLLYTS